MRVDYLSVVLLRLYPGSISYTLKRTCSPVHFVRLKGRDLLCLKTMIAQLFGVISSEVFKKSICYWLLSNTLKFCFV